MLKVGQEAPDFSKVAHEGTQVNLADFRDRQHVVLYFYPRDETPGCTAQACAFRDLYEDFVDAGAVVIGVSQDDEASHQRFAEARRLPFLLVSDEDGALQKAYGVKKTLGLMPGRATFVIDRQGVIRHSFNSQFQAQRHVSEALGAIKALQPDDA